MTTGAITRYIDVAQIALYVFWIFFAGLIIYLRREDKREGYPLESGRSERSGGRVKVVGFPAPPAPKTFRLAHGAPVTVPDAAKDAGAIAATPTAAWPGAPLEPSGDPMRAAVGPGAYAARLDVPDLTFEGEPKIVPLRAAPGFSVGTPETDPRGMAVVGADRARGGTVRELWVDRSEPQVRYLEIEAAGRTVLLPVALGRIDTYRREVRVRTILGGQFAGAPGTARPDRVTRLEEERIAAYYAGGTLYAEPARSEPLL
jgi:photosynthetic reaction center H subunit